MIPSALLDSAMLQGEEPVHGSDGAIILPLIQKGGVNLIGSLILKSI
jgi:hypothetical protein